MHQIGSSVCKPLPYRLLERNWGWGGLELTAWEYVLNKRDGKHITPYLHSCCRIRVLFSNVLANCVFSEFYPSSPVHCVLRKPPV